LYTVQYTEEFLLTTIQAKVTLTIGAGAVPIMWDTVCKKRKFLNQIYLLFIGIIINVWGFTLGDLFKTFKTGPKESLKCVEDKNYHKI
jgi:hypothetical protein